MQLRPKHQAIYLTVIIALIVINYITLIKAAWPFTTDDAYITLRYAHNWYYHHKLIWNVNGKPIEGYSNFLYVVLAYVSYAFHWNAMLFLKMLGAVSIMGSLVFTYLISRFWLDTFFALIPSVILSTSGGEYYWAVSGLETLFFQWALLMTVYFFMRAMGFLHCSENYISRKNDHRHFIFLTLSFIGLCSVALARFDGLFALGMVGLLWIVQYPGAPFRSKEFILYFLGFFVLYGVYFGWRYHYFGSILPNTYLCKTYAFRQFDINTSWYTLLEFLKSFGLFVLFSTVFLIQRFKKEVLILLLCSLLYVALFYDTDFVLDYRSHYSLPVLPYVLIFGVTGMLLVLKMFIQQITNGIKYCILAILIGLGAFAYHDKADIHHSALLYQQRNASRMAAAAYLNQQLKPKDRILLGDCGLIPFLLKDRTILDLMCLNSSVYTQQCYHHSHYADCVMQHFLKLNPTFIVINSYQFNKIDPFQYYVNERITKTNVFKKHYELSSIFRTKDHMNYFIFHRVS